MYVEPYNESIVASADSHCFWLSVLTWMSVTWIFDFVADYSVTTQLGLILVVAVKDLAWSSLISKQHVLTSMNARIEILAPKMLFVKIEKEVISALVILDLKGKHVRTLMNALSTTRRAMKTLIVTILQEAFDALVVKVFLVQARSVQRVNVRTRFVPKTRDVNL